MKRGIILAIGLILLTVPLLACLPAKPTTPTVEYESKSAHNDDIASVKNSINSLDQNKANDSSLRSLRDEVNSRLSNISGGNSYSKSETYTKSEVDQKIKDALDALKADQSWVKKTTTTTGGGTTVPTSDTGSVTWSTNPSSIPQVYSSTSGGSQSVFYTLKLSNGSTTWQYVKPIIMMSIQSSYSARAITGITITMSTGSCSMTGARTSSDSATSTIGNFSVSPNVGSGATTTSSLTIIPINGCNGTGEIQIGAGQSMDVLVQISNLTSSDVALWNITNSISARSL